MATQQTHAQIIDAIAAINLQIPGVVTSYGSYNFPQQIGNMPASVVLLGTDDYGKFGATEYLIRVFVAAYQSSGNPGLIYKACLDLSTQFRNTYSLMTSMIGDRFIDRTKLQVKAGFGSTGFGYTLSYGTGKFYGFQVNLPLMSSVPGA